MRSRPLSVIYSAVAVITLVGGSALTIVAHHSAHLNLAMFLFAFT